MITLLYFHKYAYQIHDMFTIGSFYDLVCLSIVIILPAYLSYLSFDYIYVKENFCWNTKNSGLAMKSTWQWRLYFIHIPQFLRKLFWYSGTYLLHVLGPNKVGCNLANCQVIFIKYLNFYNFSARHIFKFIWLCNEWMKTF